MVLALLCSSVGITESGGKTGHGKEILYCPAADGLLIARQPSPATPLLDPPCPTPRTVPQSRPRRPVKPIACRTGSRPAVGACPHSRRSAAAPLPHICPGGPASPPAGFRLRNGGSCPESSSAIRHAPRAAAAPLPRMPAVPPSFGTAKLMRLTWRGCSDRIPAAGSPPPGSEDP